MKKTNHEMSTKEKPWQNTEKRLDENYQAFLLFLLEQVAIWCPPGSHLHERFVGHGKWSAMSPNEQNLEGKCYGYIWDLRWNFLKTFKIMMGAVSTPLSYATYTTSMLDLNSCLIAYISACFIHSLFFFRFPIDFCYKNISAYVLI